MKTQYNSDFRIGIFPKLIIFNHQGAEAKEQIAAPPEKKPARGKNTTAESAKREGAKVIDSANKSLDQLSSGEKNTENNNKVRDSIEKEIAHQLDIEDNFNPYFWQMGALEDGTNMLEKKLQTINKLLEANLDKSLHWPPEMSPSQIGLTGNYQGKCHGVRINVSYTISSSSKDHYRVNIKTTPVDKLTDNKNRYVGPQKK